MQEVWFGFWTVLLASLIELITTWAMYEDFCEHGFVYLLFCSTCQCMKMLNVIIFSSPGTIIATSPTASPADALIQTIGPHRRARTAAWNYHFYPDEPWVELVITLPFAVLLRQVQIRPHNGALTSMLMVYLFDMWHSDMMYLCHGKLELNKCLLLLRVGMLLSTCGGSGPNGTGSPPEWESQELNSRFLFPLHVLVCFFCLLVFVFIVFLPYQPIHLHYFW